MRSEKTLLINLSLKLQEKKYQNILNVLIQVVLPVNMSILI